MDWRFLRKDWTEHATYCHGLVDLKVLGHRLDSMIVEFFSNIIGSVLQLNWIKNYDIFLITLWLVGLFVFSTYSYLSILSGKHNVRYLRKAQC